ncbi:LacI family DNA-binding transcriptional regulator [Nocardioides astragali]|uniref:LacI family DNA-binding transcriptional regulator n=1 Tax=Nocardioides astragali TaxID=1776736 RepID=A0ABW2MZW6_9ACTN|nr:LacI family DNA-binding transcriptional regulator [Nocardioides astragali]
MLPTIRDVAKEAGVSIATVSRVMRESEGVRDATRLRVLAAAAELEYTPSHLGRQLAERRHAANGIVFPDLSGPYYAEVVLGYEGVAAELRRSVLILSTHGRSDAEDAVREMAGRCDGLVILGRTVSDAAVQSLAARGTKLVLVARPPIGTVDSVNAENHASARSLTEHLLSEGVRSLRFVGDPVSSPDVAERWAGVRDAFLRSESDRAPELVTVDELDEESGAAVADAALAADDLPDAFVCGNDELALGLLGRLAAAGVDVPGTVMVTGWDDVMAARYAGLTTVRQPMRELGATAARLLEELIVDERTEPRHELLPTELVIRSSSSTSH